MKEARAPLPEITRTGGKTRHDEGDVTFGAYRFDGGTGRLWTGTREIRLTPKASAVLGVLVTRAGEPVSKDDLFSLVWADTAVTDDALTSCIQELRRALDDDAKQPRFIETRHRRGYRFVATVSTESGAENIEPAFDASELSAIAVLPFADMSPERNQDYLCEGLAEELINALTHVQGLRVAARTASFQFRSAGADVREIGRRLAVGSLLEGSVRKADDRLRVTVQLIEVASGFHRWSQRFDRRLDDVFAIQDEIAESIANSLRGGDLSGREKQALARPQTSAAAYEYYLRGRQRLFHMTRGDVDASRELLERAIELDRNYSPAWSCLSAVHATLYEWFGGNEDDLRRAEGASQQALTLAPDHALAHVARGFVLSLSGRYDEAAQEYEHAIQINPNQFEAYYYYARSSFASGSIEQSAVLFRKAADVRHEDFQSAMLLAQSLRMIGRRDEARDARHEGIRRAEHMLELNPSDGRALSLGSGTLYDDGQTARAREWSRRSLELYPDDMSTLLNAACLACKAREKEQALEYLERVFARGWGKRDWIDHDPDYDILRDHPRFQQLLSRLK
jgi:TolB-like protein/Tfp pilus assembly protein PilF